MIDSTGISQSYTFEDTTPDFVVLYGTVAVVLFRLMEPGILMDLP
ncbi:hypothetical protein Ocin01_20202, partial [Orchesella cincta]